MSEHTVRIEGERGERGELTPSPVTKAPQYESLQFLRMCRGREGRERGRGNPLYREMLVTPHSNVVNVTTTFMKGVKILFFSYLVYYIF